MCQIGLNGLRKTWRVDRKLELMKPNLQLVVLNRDRKIFKEFQTIWLMKYGAMKNQVCPMKKFGFYQKSLLEKICKKSCKFFTKSETVLL